MFGEKVRLFKIHYCDYGGLITHRGETIVVAKNEVDAIKQMQKRAIYVGCDITKIEEYEVDKIEQ